MHIQLEVNTHITKKLHLDNVIIISPTETFIPIYRNKPVIGVVHARADRRVTHV